MLSRRNTATAAPGYPAMLRRSQRRPPRVGQGSSASHSGQAQEVASSQLRAATYSRRSPLPYSRRSVPPSYEERRSPALLYPTWAAFQSRGSILGPAGLEGAVDGNRRCRSESGYADRHRSGSRAAAQRRLASISPYPQTGDSDAGRSGPG